MTPPQAQELGQQTRKKLLDTTVALVAEVGWGGVTTRLVADRAGVNNAAVNYHFSTKAALLREAAGQALAALLEGPVVEMLSGPSVLEGVRGLLLWVGAVDVGTPAMKMLLETMLQAPRDPELARSLRDMLAGFRAGLAERLRGEQESGRVAGELSATATACLVAALADGLLLHRLVEPGLATADVADALVAMLQVRS